MYIETFKKSYFIVYVLMVTFEPIEIKPANHCDIKHCFVKIHLEFTSNKVLLLLK